MAKDGDTWIMRGPSWDDPSCIRTMDEAAAYINRTGFLPLFRNAVPGFSLEEHTAPEVWWCEDPERDPWIWRERIARSGTVAYGKFFDQKAGFISAEWLPYFANVRRDGYDFDALWDDAKASRKQKRIMDLFAEEAGDRSYFSFELKQRAGFGKGGESGFEGVITGLQMQTYLCIRDFRRRRNRLGEEYGWSIAVYSTPEQLWGYDHVTSAYREPPAQSALRIAERIAALYPGAGERAVRRMVPLR